METTNEGSTNLRTESEQREYPFGLLSPQFTVLVVLIGLIGPDLLVYALEEANLSAVADLEWIIGYGTTIFVGWFIWLRPLDFVGTLTHDTSLTEESDQSEIRPEGRDGKSESSDSAELSAQDSIVAAEDMSQGSTQEKLASQIRGDSTSNMNL